MRANNSIISLFFIGFIAVELLGLSLFVYEFGFLLLALEVVFSGALGVWIWVLHTHSISASLNEMLELFARGRAFSLIKSSVLAYFGAFLLVLPGIFGDIVGLVLVCISLILRPSNKQSEFKQHFDEFYKRESSDFDMREPKKRRDFDDDIIDAEVIDIEITAQSTTSTQNTTGAQNTQSTQDETPNKKDAQ
ncbi:hypothetical protein BKN38_01660 [Helicobacter sp. CLO-3]|uniref:FxsA family protein n=1 Tax=unclassified Helicobacter TaxID=2593540 RepID=UPI000806017B|nr:MULTISPECIES: FxsA family protein [unclassified Helicobacter]OBV29610.1 hypothetical protein BA723_04840 [Helicobacter sp. CLO-3]OHU85260.1 hypothetical protein BKN38_01660 [Helicobacter sp. CLO-3]